MNRNSTARIAFVVTLSLAALVLLCGVAAAQSAQIEGVIDGRSGATMTVKTQDAGNVVVLLSDSTQVKEVERRTTTFPASWVLTVMVAPLRPSITPSIWALCAAATPHSSTSAASDRVTTKAILAVLFRFIILLSYSLAGATCSKVGLIGVTNESTMTGWT